MPSGIPVATVAVDGAENAGLLAIQILAVKYNFLKEKLKAHKEKMKQDVINKDERIKREVF
jgi:5-(carboxyamino)imidazole ribonucleotide mutase